MRDKKRKEDTEETRQGKDRKGIRKREQKREKNERRERGKEKPAGRARAFETHHSWRTWCREVCVALAARRRRTASLHCSPSPDDDMLVTRVAWVTWSVGSEEEPQS